MRHHISSKLKRTLTAISLAAIVLGGGLMLARPFVPFLERGEAHLNEPVLSEDSESARTARDVVRVGDGDLEDRIGQPVERVMHVASGDTLMDLLTRAGVDGAEATQAINALRDVYNPRSLKAGQKVTVAFERPSHGLGVGEFKSVSLYTDPIHQVAARRQPDRGDFAASESKKPVTRQIARYSGTITSSLYENALANGVPIGVIATMIKWLSYDVDFQRDIQPGDTFDVMFEGFYDNRGKLARHGEMLYAALKTQGETIILFRHEDRSGQVDYYNAKGESVRKALLKTPVDGAKISSGFGMRRHPILGFTKMHKGVDFAVPPGTPIQAAGDGVVEMAGPNGAYGNYVRLRHNNGFGTAYAHMSRIGNGIRSGSRVQQGQIVGYVGSTGRSTGPHLHFEVLKGVDQVNPLSIKIPNGVKLAGKDLDLFLSSRQQTEKLLAEIPPSSKMAVSETESRPN